MKIIGIFILILELLALALQVKNECKRNNITVSKAKEQVKAFRNKFKSAPKYKPSTWKRGNKK